MKKYISFVVLVLLFYTPNILSVEKGSNSVVSIEPFATFPATDTDNKMLAFGWFKNGFNLEDSSTSCTFESVFPVSGSVILNGGTLYLNSDLHLANVTTFTALGKIVGNNHIVEIDSSVEQLFNTANDVVLKDVDLFLHSDLQFSTTVRCEGNCYFNGRGRTIALDDDVEVLVGSNSTLHIKNVNMSGVSRSKVRCIDETGKLILDNSSFILDANYNFTVGSLVINNEVDFYGVHTLFYDCIQTLTINSNSIVSFYDGVTFAVGINSVLAKDRIIYFEDSSAKIGIEDANLSVANSGIQLTRGTLSFAGRVGVDINSTDTTNGVILGDGTADGDFVAEFSPASHINFANGHVVYNEYDSAKFVSGSVYSKLIRGATNVFHIERNQLFSNVTIKVEPTSALTVADGTQVNYQNCKMILPGVKFSITGSRYNTYTSLLDGSEEIFIEEGTLPLYLVIANSGNKVIGNGSLTGLITLYNSDAQLAFNLDGSLLNDIDLNGGAISLENRLCMNSASMLLGEGTVDLATNDFVLGSRDLSWTSSIYWDGTCGKVDLNSKVSLSSTWTFSGYCKLVGNGHNFIFNPTGKIVVEKGSTLVLEDIRIQDICSENISCVDDTSTIILNGVFWSQSDDYCFNNGGLEIINDADLGGIGSFCYDSLQTLTIHNNSQLRFCDGITFALGVSTSLNKDRLVSFEDSTSKFFIDNANLHVGESGVVLTKGVLLLGGGVDVDIDSTDTTNGMFFGNGIAGEDVKAQFMPASYVNFKNGHLVYNNINPDRFVSLSKYSKLIRGASNHFYAKHDVNYTNVSVSVDPSSELSVADGVQVGYSDCKMILPGVKFSITGSRFDTYTSLLAGNQEIFLEEGTLPLYLLVMNSGNMIRGNGNISGLTTLYDSDAEISYNLNGSVLNDINLNGGKIILDNDLRLGHNAKLLTGGTVNLSDKDISFGEKDLSCTATIYWDGNYGAVKLNSNINLYSTWTFSGNCTIDAAGYILFIKSSGQINVEKGSTLTIRNIRLGGLAGTNLCCFDDAGTIIFNGGKCKMFDDYLFETGRFIVANDWEVKGSHIFYYKTNQQSEISHCTELLFHPGSGFSYSPSTDSRDLIKMNCESVFCFNDASLHSTTTGLTLIGGALRIDGNCVVSSDATIKSEGITLGDGESTSCDTMLDILHESNLELTSGYLVYKSLN